MPNIEFIVDLLYLAMLTANIFTVEFDESCEELLVTQACVGISQQRSNENIKI
jgi:hypothetical protein